MKESKTKRYIIDNFISNKELLWIYDSILDSEGWKINCHPGNGINSAFSTHPVLLLQNENEIKNLFWAGYFQRIIHTISDELKKKENIILPSKIRRIHIIAKSSYSDSELHIDSDSENSWSIVGFLNPNWENSDGGNFILNNEIINNKPGRFIVFKSNSFHDGMPIKNKKLKYWRLVLNIIIYD